MSRLQRFGTFRQLHTIFSKEIIKPSSPTPPHLKTHNLSLIDRFAPDMYMPMVFFYPNYVNGDINNLKKSLSQCLTQYYPFAGRLPMPTIKSHVDCNDEGIGFLEASHDSRLDEFILKIKEHEEMTYQLFPNGLGCIAGKSSPNLVEVQMNHFNGGGAALAVSLSHKLADGFGMANFINQWSIIKRGGSPIRPNFFPASTRDDSYILELPLNNLNEVKYETRVFVFPNSKLNELKKKVSTMGILPSNPSRVESLTSLLFKCEVDATTTISGVLNPSTLMHTMNMRNILIKNNLEKAAGNIVSCVFIKTKDLSDIKLNEVVAKLKTKKNDLEGFRDVQEVGESLINEMTKLGGDPSQQMYLSTSLCRFPFYEVDFGWGKPIKVKVVFPNTGDRLFMLMDTPNGDGIEARVHLPEEEMLIFQEHKELLTYIHNQ